MRMAMQTDVAILNGGSLRSDRIHQAGCFTLKVNLPNLIGLEEGGGGSGWEEGKGFVAGVNVATFIEIV